MSNWETIPVNQLVETGEASLQTGPFGTQLKASEYVSVGIPVINVRNIGYGHLTNAPVEYVNKQTSERLSVHQLAYGDIVFGRKGAVDRHVLIKKDSEGWIQGSDCLRLRIQSDRFSNKFISYYFSTQAHKSWMEAQGSFGATMSSLNQGIIKRINIPLFSLDIQKKIAAVLSAYDDLIENNNRRITLLEKMAEEIYREWFVRLRFPGHEQVARHKGIPEKWELIKISDAFEITGGGTPSKKESSYWLEGNVDWFTPSDITSASGMILFSSGLQCTKVGLNNSSAKLFPAYSIMMTSRATIGALGINTTPACTNQGFITCIPNESYPLEFLFFWLKLNKSYFEMLASGATFAELSKAVFKKISVLTPPKALIREYSDNITPIFKQIEAILRKQTLLQQTRDRLLPRLISGKLSVEDLDIQFPPNMGID